MITKLIALCAFVLCASAQSAGIHRLSIPNPSAGHPPIQGVLWTPCAQPAEQLQLGPFALRASKDCPVNATQKLPLVIVSHGYGGSNLSHHSMAASLADSGFAVLAINHTLDSALNMAQGGTLAALLQRPADISAALDFLLAQPTWRGHIDPGRIGFFGFSRGGYTGLVLAGAQPDFRHAQFECADMRIPLCQSQRDPHLPPMKFSPDARIKAYVLADPLSAFPTRASVYHVRAPMQLWASAYGGDGIVPGSVQALAQQLPASTALQVVANGNHFAFMAPCTPALAAIAPEVCADPPGFDRAAFLPPWTEAVRAFFAQKL